MSQQQPQNTGGTSMGIPSTVGGNANVNGPGGNGSAAGPPPPPHAHHYTPPHLQAPGMGTHPLQQQFGLGSAGAPGGVPTQQQRHPQYHQQQQQHPVFSSSTPLNQQQQRQMYAALVAPGNGGPGSAPTGGNMFPHSQSMHMPPMNSSNSVPIGGGMTGGANPQHNVPISGGGLSMPLPGNSTNVPIHSSQQLHPQAMAAAMEGHMHGGASHGPQQMLGPHQMQQSLGVPEQVAHSQNHLNFLPEQLPSSASMPSRIDSGTMGRGQNIMRSVSGGEAASASRPSGQYYRGSGGPEIPRSGYNGPIDMQSRGVQETRAGSTEDKSSNPQMSESPVEDDYGLLGLLKVLRSGDANRNMLSLGVDLTTLGLSLNTKSSLHPTFNLPWTDRPVAKESEYNLPDCYKTPHPPLRTGHFKKFTLETLVYIFYSMPRDILQAYAAQELYRRGWRFHQELRLWLLYDPETAVELSPPTEADKKPEYNYVYFDVQSWEKKAFAGNTVRDAPVNRGFIPAEEIHIPRPNTGQSAGSANASS